MAEHLDGLLSEPGATPHTWAVAGRSEHKLKLMTAKLKTKPDFVVASTKEELGWLAERCSVLVSAAGPYHLCGSDVVEACVASKTHYIDVTGEVVWMKAMVRKFHKKAKEDGLMIVHCSGAMCAPNDISLYLLAKKLGPLKQFREYSFGVGPFSSGGTFHTGYQQYNNMIPHDFEHGHLNPFSLGGQRQGGTRPIDADPSGAERDVLFPNVFLYPGHSSHPASRILRRSVALFEEMPSDGLVYGDSVSITTRCCSLDEKTAQVTAKSMKGPEDVKNLIKYSETMEKAVALGNVPKLGGGPPQECRQHCRMESYGVAEGENGEWAHVHCNGPEGYEVTAMTALAGALVMLEEADRIRMKDRGGVLTPAVAFHGSTWLERLASQHFGHTKGKTLVFEVLDGKPTEETIIKAIMDCDQGNGGIMDAVRKGMLSNWELPELYNKKKT